jgi:hypothetical protein
MPSRGSDEVGQRRFWNALADRPGIIYIGTWGGLGGSDPTGQGEGDYLWASDDGADWTLVYTGDQLTSGVLPFPTQFKLSRYWRLTHRWTHAPNSDWDGTNEWIFKPYSTDFSLVGPDAWQRGADWQENLFYASSKFSIPTTIHYRAKAVITATTYGFGGGGPMYGYLNNHYFGHNEMGGNKPNEGVGPKLDAIGDLSKSYVGFWGALGTAHGVANPEYSIYAYWIFDLCDTPEIAAVVAALKGNQTEGWGTDVATIEPASVHGHRHFTIEVSPARGTINVYTPRGEMLVKGVDWDNDDCDRSGRVYKYLRPDPTTRCGLSYRVVVTYLVPVRGLRRPRRTARIVAPDTAADRLRDLDIRGL